MTDAPTPPVGEPQEGIGASDASTPLDGADPFIALPLPPVLRFAEVDIPIGFAVTGTIIVQDLPLHAWESVQAVHGPFLQWCRGTIHCERTALGWTPTSESLAPYRFVP